MMIGDSKAALDGQVRVGSLNAGLKNAERIFPHDID